ncbi:MAG: stage IV sporulation protein A [Bacilli bacterium]|nr:stage IV sporulation protein A [Bacilli bacterium]MDD4796124.1 stage IV sporulation protein A [Bacilli bacterium]
MEKKEIISSISAWGQGEIYLGVVGAVRTGKSTFIKKVIETLVIPNIDNEQDKKRCLDEIPQSAPGKTIMTTEPKFVPSSGATITIDEFTTNIKLIDCVGYVIKSASGYEDEIGNPRLVKTPWYSEEIPFIEAAEIGTEKVIRDHSTIGIVVTTDGSIGEFTRGEYMEAEEKVITELTAINKPFIIILNTKNPGSDEAIRLAKNLTDNYNAPVMPINIESMTELEMYDILKTALYEFPVLNVEIKVPEWVHILDNENEVKKHYLDKIKESMMNVSKLKDVDNIISYFENSEFIDKAYISNVDTSNGMVTLNLNSSDDLYNNILREVMGGITITKGSLLKVFTEYAENKEETSSLKSALKMAKNAGYGIVYPTLKDMKLSTPEIIKQGSRYGVKLKAVASSIHLMKVDVESTFEPIIGTELQSKELINYIMKDYENDPESIWKSEIFGRSLDMIVKEGIQAKLSMMPEATRYKLSNTVTKIVNKGSHNLIAIVL